MPAAARTALRHTQGDKGITIRFPADRAGKFLAEWERNGPEAAQRKYGSDAQAGVPTIRDPRGFGVAGAYPRTGPRINPALVDRLYDEVGLFGAIADQISEDTFSEAWGFTSEENPAWCEQAMDAFLELDLPGAIEDADRNVLMHGYGVCLWRLDDVETPNDLQRPPPKSADVAEVVSLDIPKIGKAYEDPDAAAGEPLLVGLELRLRKGQTVRCHAARLTVLREKPILDDPLMGKARLRKVIDSVVLYENTKYWAGESFSRRASPMVQAVVDPDAKLQPATREEIKEKLKGLINGTAQSAIVKDYKFETVGGFSGIVNPQTQWQMAVDSVATDSRIPKHLLVGSAAGELASSTEDTKRYYARISRRQERYGTRVVLDFVRRLVEYGRLPPAPTDLRIQWTPLDEPSQLDRAAAWKAHGEAMQAMKAAGAPFPSELTEYSVSPLPEDPSEEGPAIGDPSLSVAPDTALNGAQVESLLNIVTKVAEGLLPRESGVKMIEASFPLTYAQADAIVADAGQGFKPALPAAPPGRPPPPGPQPPEEGTPEGQPDDPAEAPREADPETAGDAALLPEDPDLKVVRLRHQARIQAAMNDWMDAYVAVFRRDPRADRAGGDQLDPKAPVVRGAARIRLDPLPLARTVRALLNDAALRGGQAQWRRLKAPLAAPRTDAGEKDFEFIDDTPARTFKALADSFAKQQAESLTGTIRASIARGLAAGESVRDLKVRVLAEFDFTPMESERIARTEAMRGYNYGSREALRQVGATHYELQVFGDACPTCTALRGQRFPITDSQHMPPLHPNDRCTITQVFL